MSQDLRKYYGNLSLIPQTEGYSFLELIAPSVNIHESMLVDLPLYLRKVDLSNNSITSAESLVVLQSLIYLSIHHNVLTDFPLNNMSPNLRFLDLSHNQLSSFLASSPSLEVLDLSNNVLSSFEASYCPNLKKISLSHNPLSTVSLSDLPILEELDLSNTEVTSLPIIPRSVTKLKAQNCQSISDLSTLADVISLKSLDLSGSSITLDTLKPIKSLKNLNEIFVADTELASDRVGIIVLCPSIILIDREKVTRDEVMEAFEMRREMDQKEHENEEKSEDDE
ncbi:hypothetical protein RCL1_004208 [Eukaryota sp. TZLM3-RCL]